MKPPASALKALKHPHLPAATAFVKVYEAKDAEGKAIRAPEYHLASEKPWATHSGRQRRRGIDFGAILPILPR
jgi:hypothetical protein